MTRLIPLILALSLTGCIDTLFVPAKEDTAPVAKPQVTTAQFFTAFADHVEKGAIDHTQRVKTVCDKAMHEAGVSPPANYETVMSQYTKVNKVVDADLRAKIVGDLRGFAK